MRTSDPYTSHAAAASVKPKRASIKDHILLELAIHGGCTGTEIANRCAIRLNSITPRFAELSGKKYATRRCISLKNVPETERKIKASGERRDGQIVWVLA